jgi:hypothetical protein
MTVRPERVSVIDPIGPAIDRVKTVLFDPFDLRKWLVIGFSAWLANLGQHEGGGGGGGGGDGGGRAPDVRSIPAELSRGVERAQDFVASNLHWIIPLGILLAVLIVVITLVVVWLSSRARFSFLYCVAQNRGEFWAPWRRYRDHGNSLFGFRIVLTIVGFVMVVGFLAPIGVLAVMLHRGTAPSLPAIWGLIVCAMLFLCAVVVLGLTGKFTRDFVVPIMYARTASWVDGWRILLDLMAFNKWRFFIYVLFQAVIGFIVGAIVLAGMCFTCCCACCFLAIPYIGTVVLLPVLVFLRAYSLYYLEQYGPEFCVIAPEPEMIPPPQQVPTP